MLFGAVGLSVLLFVITVGGIGEVWQSLMGRGAGQFIERDMLGRVVHMLTMLRLLGGSMAFLAFSLSSHARMFILGSGSIGVATPAALFQMNYLDSFES